MTTHHSSPSVLRGAAQLLAGVPYLLNYRPERSLVLVGSLVDRARLGRQDKLQLPVTMMLRVDLPAAEDVAALVDQLASPVRLAVRERGAGLLDPLLLLHLFLYDADDDLAQALVPAAQERLRAEGAEVHAALLTRDGAYRSLMPEGPPRDEAAGAAVDASPEGDPEHRVPAVWTPLPDPSGVPAVADLVLQGRNPARSRADVAATVRTRDERAAARTGLSIAVQDLDDLGPDPLPALETLGRIVRGEVAPTPHDRAVVAMSLADRWVRDLVLGHWLPDVFTLQGLELDAYDRRLMRSLGALPDDPSDGLHRLFRLSGAVPVDWSAPLLTLAGCLAWRHGEGTVANEAVDLALEADPDYRMAQLMRHALSHGVPPWAVRRRAEAA
ncbi:DUF4192 domain-containing protein [Ornithinimicrobium tianjinense]|nr:DUF4192 domain-containing protein [Ornithinimicrobium tianjinense]